MLLDDTGTVKIADFGVARVMDTGGIMTAETGTYRYGIWPMQDGNLVPTLDPTGWESGTVSYGSLTGWCARKLGCIGCGYGSTLGPEDCVGVSGF